MKPRIVILGGGFGGAYCAQALNRAVRRGRIDLTLIERHNYFIFYPLLIEAGTGNLHPRHAVVSIRSFTGAGTFRMGEIVDVDTDAQGVYYRIARDGEVFTAPYDHLVISMGSVSSLPEVPGLREHGFEIKSLVDAVALRDHAIRLLEMADAAISPERRRALLHLVVVGGNFTGVEVAGEFHGHGLSHCTRLPYRRGQDLRGEAVRFPGVVPVADGLPGEDAGIRAQGPRGPRLDSGPGISEGFRSARGPPRTWPGKANRWNGNPETGEPDQDSC